jgi:pyruvate dehydrogenase E2 component (dihydrolipoamide acetyltransferase)
MTIEIILPALGETMDEGTIARWTVASGARVTKGQVIAEIESNKAVFELESTGSGVLTILVPAGASVPILTVIARLGTAGEMADAVGQQAVPAQMEPNGEPEVSSHLTAAPATAAEPGHARRFVSPRARRFAAQHGIDPALVSGTGPQGRVEERDVRASLESRPRLSPLAKKLAAEAGVTIAPITGAPKERIMRADVERQMAPPEHSVPTPSTATEAETAAPLSLIRRIIADRMTQSAHTPAGVTLTTEVDAEELVHLREQIKAHVERQAGHALSYNVLLAKLCAVALGELPYMNTRLDGETVHTHAAANIGIAVDTERGLLVPVLCAANSKSLVELSREAGELTARAKSGVIGADEMAGGTFTITNLGMYGIDAFTPLINLPECAILGVGRIAARPAVWQGQIAIRQTCVLSLTFDHRLVDGAPAARFLQRVAELIQNPYVVLL